MRIAWQAIFANISFPVIRFACFRALRRMCFNMLQPFFGHMQRNAQKPLIAPYGLRVNCIYGLRVLYLFEGNLNVEK